MERTYIKDVNPKKEVLLKGWVHEIRNLSKLSFLIIRDMTGMVQCVVKDEKLMKYVSEITLESVVEI